MIVCTLACPCIPVVLFIMLFKVFLTFESVDEILKCDHSNASNWTVFVCAGVIMLYWQGSYNFWVWGWNPKVWPFKWKLLSSTFTWCSLLCCTDKAVITFESVDEIPKCDHSSESYWAVLCTIFRSAVTIQMKATEQYFPVVQFVFKLHWQGSCKFWVCHLCPGLNTTMIFRAAVTI